MKKFLISTGTVLMVSMVANACGGIQITDISENTYCMAKYEMNWYSAYTWCRNQGMHMVELKDCDASFNGFCKKFKLSSDEKNKIKENGANTGTVWTSSSYSLTNPYNFYLETGHVDAHVRRSSSAWVLCR